MSEFENNPLHCSFVGVQYLVCECGEALQNEESLRIHLEQKHPRRPIISVRHLKRVPPPITEYKCGECGQIYSTEEECLTHQEIDHIPFMEEVVYQEDEDVKDNIIPDIVIPSTSTRLHCTPEPTMALMTQPPVRVQSLPPKKMVSAEKKPRMPRKKRAYRHKNVQCETCGKKYASNAALRYHQRVHTGVKPYQCMYCPKAFTMSLFLQIHIRTHTGEKPYHCPSCPKAFGNRAALLRHDRVHTGIKPYQCPKCGKCFTQSNSMKLHFHTVHLKLPAPYKSKRRQAEIRERKSKQAMTDSEIEAQVQAIKTEIQDPEQSEQMYYVKTPSGRQITLTTIVPKKAQQQVPETLLNAEEADIPVIEPKPELKEEELFYYDVKSETIEEEVAYEIIYE